MQKKTLQKHSILIAKGISPVRIELTTSCSILIAKGMTPVRIELTTSCSEDKRANHYAMGPLKTRSLRTLALGPGIEPSTSALGATLSSCSDDPSMRVSVQILFVHLSYKR
jgi:hypothetical protein